MTKTYMRRPIVAFFGSSREPHDSFLYSQVQQAALYCAEHGFRIATGGGPGLMEAANEGAQAGALQYLGEYDLEESNLVSLGYSIDLENEEEPNEFVGQETEHKTFFTRLEQFMECDAFIACPGGWGTLLETLMVIQLLQAKHMEHKPLYICGRGIGNALAHFQGDAVQRKFIDANEGPFYKRMDWPIEAAIHLCGPESTV